RDRRRREPLEHLRDRVRGAGRRVLRDVVRVVLEAQEARVLGPQPGEAQHDLARVVLPAATAAPDRGLEDLAAQLTVAQRGEDLLLRGQLELDEVARGVPAVCRGLPG